MTQVARRERPNWGLAQLMRPAEAAPGVPFVPLPLCRRPNVNASNHHGILTRWSHLNLRSSLPMYIFVLHWTLVKGDEAQCR